MKRSLACVISETGRREVNQDRACAEHTTVFGEPALLMAVADGMGGMSAGDVAAEIAIATVREFASDVLPSVPAAPGELGAAIVRLFQAANRRVWERGQQDGTAGDTGTTLVCCVQFGNRYLVANAGDSRCYYVNSQGAHPITEDHSRVQDMVRRGVMSPEAARRSPFRSELLNALGEPRDIRVDVFPAPDKYGVIEEPCVLMLSSDGLHGPLSDRAIFEGFAETPSVDEACADLISLAMAEGSTDNISLVAVEVGRLPRVDNPNRSRALAEPPKGPITVKLVPPTPPRPARRSRTLVAAAAALVLVAAAGTTGLYVSGALRSLVSRVWHGMSASGARTDAPRPSPAPNREEAAASEALGVPASPESSPHPQPAGGRESGADSFDPPPVGTRLEERWDAGLTYQIEAPDRVRFAWRAYRADARYTLEIARRSDFGRGTESITDLRGSDYTWRRQGPGPAELYARIVALFEEGSATSETVPVILTKGRKSAGTSAPTSRRR